MATDALSTFLAARNRLALTLFSAEAYYNVVEAAFLILILYLALTRAYKPRSNGLSEQDRAHRLASWKAEPLATPLPRTIAAARPADVSLASGASPIVHSSDGTQYLNLATTNFLGLAQHPRVTSRAHEVLKSYGCGSCGPRGFYGTTDVHMRTEVAIAKFSNTKSAILYSHGATTGSSIIPAFAKRGDLIICDEYIHFGLQTGVTLSRAEAKPFRHCDVAALEAVMKEVIMDDSKDPSRQRIQKRFVMIEALYANSGMVAPLKEIVELKNKYGFRLIMDESFSLGVLGKSGLGALEHSGVDREDVDIAMADLGNAIGSVGGYCVGDSEVVSHQRLSGAGYCFSASQPPFLAAAVTTALEIIKNEGTELTERLRTNTAEFQTALRAGLSDKWTISGHLHSPLLHIRAREGRVVDGATMTKVQKICMQRGVLVTRPEQVAQEQTILPPSIRVTVMVGHKPARLREAAAIIADALKQVEQ